MTQRISRPAFLAVLLAGTACLLPTGAALAQDTIKIGVPTAQSGTYADLGNQAKRAVDLAIHQANAAGGILGRKLEARYLDTEAKPELARKQAEKLALEGYKLLTGTIASGEGLAMAPMLERWDAIYVSTINKTNKINGDACVPRMFRVNKADAMDAAVVKPWLATRKEQKWAFLGADIQWGRDVGSSFKVAVADNKRQLVSEHYSPFGTKDFAPFIQQIKQSGAEGLWIALAGLDAINFATQAKQFGLFDTVFTGGVSFVTDNTVKTLGAVSKGIWGIINYSSTLDTPENKAFVAAWKEFYKGDEPSNFEGETYIGMQVIIEAIKRAKSDKPVDVAKQLSGGTFDTILGKQVIRKGDHQMTAPNFFGVVEENGGKLRPVIKMSFPATEATPPPSADCKMGAL